MQEEISGDLDVILNVLPDPICQSIRKNGRTAELLEIILDLGRVPTARYIDDEFTISESEVSKNDIDSVLERVSAFDTDNRAGIERTLHRISAIRNRRGRVVGLTCRVGRAVYGTIDIIQDIVTSQASILLLGRPGIGKTTMLREAARVLAEQRRVVIVDTSNEIGGDGDIPHPAVGSARRMQVENPARQHEIMVEAVENHNPETIIIDEIGREREATAARTIAERGVQLIATAHGNTLDNILLNPTLADLVGGVEAVTLSDEEARRRGTQKTVLERRSSPTFDVLIEIVERERLNIHSDVASAVDGHLRGRSFIPELRYRDKDGTVNTENRASLATAGQMDNRSGLARAGGSTSPATVARSTSGPGNGIRPLCVYAYGITGQRLKQAARRLHLPLRLVHDLEAAQVFVTRKSYYRRRERPVSDAESQGLPIYVLRSNTGHQIANFLLEVFDTRAALVDADDQMEAAMGETEKAIGMVRNGARSMDLLPRAATIRRHQHQKVRKANLTSRSYGKEPNRRVRVLPE